MNFTPTATTSTASFHRKWLQRTEKSYCMMQPSAMKLVVPTPFSLPTESISPIFTQPLSCQMVSKPNTVKLLPTDQRDQNSKVKSADASTPQMDALIHHSTADTNTSGLNASVEDMTAKVVIQEMERHCRSLHPRYL